MLTYKPITETKPKFIDREKIQPLINGKGIVVEFVGPTGSGKTTNCRYFSDLLREKRLHVYIFSDVKEYFYSLNYFARFYIILNALAIYVSKFLSYTYMILQSGIYSFDSLYRYIKLCVFNEILQLFIKAKKPDVVLLDQWIIQGLWSATIFKLDGYESILHKLTRFYFKTDMVLYFDIDTKTAAERIELRDSGDSRFDKMESAKRLEGFKKYNGYLLQLYEQSLCRNKFKLSTLESPNKNAEVFLGKLIQFITHR